MNFKSWLQQNEWSNHVLERGQPVLIKTSDGRSYVSKIVNVHPNSVVVINPDGDHQEFNKRQVIQWQRFMTRPYANMQPAMMAQAVA